MNTPQTVAIYARVSSEQQAQAHTIDSQIVALHERVSNDGLDLAGEMEFIDEGYSGSTLVRPALERLRDMVSGWSDRSTVHSLARSAGPQVRISGAAGRRVSAQRSGSGFSEQRVGPNTRG